jgi:DNA-binding transcriptional MerR regulator
MLTIGDFARLGQVSPRMLRHYHELDLLRPERVDPTTGYRSYGPAQLVRLHRLLALRGLGFSLEQVRQLLDDELSLEQLRGMLRLRQAQMEQAMTEEQARLRQVEAHLRALEGSTTVAIQDVVLKSTQPLRVAEATDTAPGFGPELGEIFGRLYPRLFAHIERSGAKPGLCVAWYEEPAEDGSVVVHAGVEVDGQAVADGQGVRVTDLPVVDVAAVMYRGLMAEVGPVYEALARWIDDSGYRLGGRSRELYYEWHPEDPSASVTELQFPITRT